MKNVLIFGTGSIAKKHIKNLISLKYKVHVYSKENKIFFEKNKIVKKLSTLKNLPIFDFAIVANKTNEHLDTIKFLIDKKIHIYCEKPIFFKKFNFNGFRKGLIKNKIIFHMGYQLLNDTKIIYIKKKIKKLQVKSFQVVVGHNFQKWRKGGVRKGSYYSNTNKGGGVIFELIHEINLINYLFGKISKIKTLKSKADKFKCEDVAVSVIETKKNLIGTLYQDMFSKTLFRNIKIFTKNKMIKIDFVKNHIFEDYKVIKFKNSNDQKNLLMKNILKFIRKIKMNNKSSSDYNDAIYDLNICLKMHDELR
tara:strand:+ start:148 stop:1071 length:924 start_codon:yes stop_codon:yes gene_type:complete